MKKFFVEKAQVQFLLRDGDGIPVGEFSLEVEGPRSSETKAERARIGVRIAGGEVPTQFRDLQRMPDLGDVIALCQDMCGPEVQVEGSWRGRLDTSYRNKKRPIPFWTAVSQVMLSYSRLREARETPDVPRLAISMRGALFNALEILWAREHPLCDRDDEGRDCWWATCVLCGVDYRHYPGQSWHDVDGNRLEKPVPNVDCHQNHHVCEACEPKARRDSFSVGKGVVLIGGYAAASSFDVISEKPGEDQKDPLRSIYEFFLRIFQERLG